MLLSCYVGRQRADTRAPKVVALNTACVSQDTQDLLALSVAGSAFPRGRELQARPRCTSTAACCLPTRRAQTQTLHGSRSRAVAYVPVVQGQIQGCSMAAARKHVPGCILQRKKTTSSENFRHYNFFFLPVTSCLDSFSPYDNSFPGSGPLYLAHGICVCTSGFMSS